MAKEDREGKLALQSAAIRLWHRRSGVFAGCVKADSEAATGRKKRNTERLVHRKGRPLWEA